MTASVRQTCNFCGCVSHPSYTTHPQHAHRESSNCDGVISGHHAAKRSPYLSRENWGGATSQGFSLKWPSWVPPFASGGWILHYVRMSRSAGALNNHQDLSPRSMWYHRRPPDALPPVHFLNDVTTMILGTSCQPRHGLSHFRVKIIDRPVRVVLEVPSVGFGDGRNFLIRDDSDKVKGSAPARGYLATT